MSMPERRTIAVGTKSVRLLEGGTGAPLLYLHSAGGDGEWGEIHERLATTFRVLLPAHPGFSDTTGLEEVDGIFDLVLHYVDFLDALGLDAVPMLGTSLGGWIGAEIAALYPARVARLVLVDAVGIWIDGTPIRELFGTQPADLAKLLFFDQEFPIAAMMRAYDPKMPLPEAILLPQLKAMEAAAKVGWNPYMHDPKLEPRLRRVTAPTLVVWGRQDGIVPLAYAEKWKQLIGNARVEVIDRCGHLPSLEQPGALADAVERFLS
jgi:pimeloyl-ACP methyl ester carboxylesterase